MILGISCNASALTNPLLDRKQIGSNDISAFTKWTALMPRYEQQRLTTNTHCIGELCLNQQWEQLLVELADKPAHTQIDRVNRFFNRIAYVTDQVNYGITDYWQTPYELMDRGGDCEDYAIAKYISLRRLNFPESDMRILIVKDGNTNGTIHAVLEVRAGGVTHILDNQSKVVVPVAQVTHYQPVYAINETKWWAYK